MFSHLGYKVTSLEASLLGLKKTQKIKIWFYFSFCFDLILSEQQIIFFSETYLGSSDKRFSDWPFFEEFAWVSFRFSSFPRYQTYLHQVDSPVSVPDQGTG